MRRYEVMYLSDEAMPTGHDWMLLEVDEHQVLALRKSAPLTPALLEEAWAGYRLLADVAAPQPQPVCHHTQRLHGAAHDLGVDVGVQHLGVSEDRGDDVRLHARLGE